MIKWLYNGKIYNSRKEMKQLFGSGMLNLEMEKLLK